MQSAALKQEVLPAEQPLAVYDPFRSMIAEMKETNSKTAFDYADSKGNKEARSYIYKLRQSKTAIEEARKKEKAASLEYGRKVDAQAKELTSEIDGMINVHLKPLQEIEEKETQRVATIKSNIQWFVIRQQCAGHSSDELKKSLAEIALKMHGDDYAEFTEQAVAERDKAVEAHKLEIPVAEKREADQAELERLRKETAERDQRDREEKLKAEAAEKAREEERLAAEKRVEELRLKAEADQREKDAALEAERKAAEESLKKEREAAEAREQELRLAAENATKEKEAAERRAAEAADNERKRAEEEQAQKLAKQKKREEDEAHKAKIKDDIKAFLLSDEIEELVADYIVAALVAGKIPHVTINY